MIRILIFFFICSGVFAQPQLAPEFNKASELAGQQKWQEAINVLQDLIQKEPNTFAFAGSTGIRIKMDLKNSADKIEHLKQILEKIQN